MGLKVFVHSRGLFFAVTRQQLPHLDILVPRIDGRWPRTRLDQFHEGIYTLRTSDEKAQCC